VQTEAAYKSYFAERAEAWEGISYMKARAIAVIWNAPHVSCTSFRRGLAALRAEHALARGPGGDARAPGARAGLRAIRSGRRRAT